MKSGVIAESKGKKHLGGTIIFIIWDIFACSQGYSVHDNAMTMNIKEKLKEAGR